MKICFVAKRFNRDARRVIRLANEILEGYAAQGIRVTLRSLYYRFVAGDLFPDDRKFSSVKGKWVPDNRKGTKNAEPNYKWLGGILTDARLAGHVDWDHLEDRSRNLASLQHFEGPQDALDRLASWYHVDMWQSQKYRPEVWIEKDALSGVIQGVCQENDVPYFACKGYTSLSEMYVASQRLKGYAEAGQTPYIVHLGDHDPSGVDMSRDIYERLSRTFMQDCEFERVALTMDQIQEYQPPPNPAKITDSRCKVYIENYGELSWELDSLEPSKFRSLVEEAIAPLRDDEQWKSDVEKRKRVTSQLLTLAKDWETLPERERRMISAEAEVTSLKKQVVTLKNRVAVKKAVKKRKG